MVHFIIEIQKTETGAAIVPPVGYDNREQAEQKYHNTLAAAAVSQVPAHTVLMINDTGDVVKAETYYHESK